MAAARIALIHATDKRATRARKQAVNKQAIEQAIEQATEQINERHNNAKR